MKQESFVRGIEQVLESLTRKKKSQADELVDLSEEAGAEFFHTPLGEPFMSLPVEGHRENWPVRSKATRRWLTHCFWQQMKKAPNSEAMQSALNVLEAKATFEGPQEQVHLRTAWHQGALYYDLCDQRWRCIRVNKKGWSIVDKAPVRFRRYSHMAPQVEPSRGGSIKRLWEFINVSDHRDRRLVRASVIISLIPNIPRPPLAFHGDQGSAKTTTAKMLGTLIDPSEAPLVRAKDEAELVQGLAHHYCVVLDNLSSLRVWLSDLLSRAVTGEGFTKRQLYTDEEDITFAYRRFIILTGIGLVITKPDLLDRSLIIGLDRVPEKKRRGEQILWEQFQAIRPGLFGAVLDLLSGAIREYEHVSLAKLPRMADFAHWACAMARGCNEDVKEFEEDLATNTQRQNEEAVLGSIVATLLLAVMENREEWTGTADELLADLKREAEDKKIHARELPGTSAVLGRRLREIRPNLRALGWEIDFGMSHHSRKITITRIDTVDAGKDPEDAVPSAPPSPSIEGQQLRRDGNEDGKGEGTDAVSAPVPDAGSSNSLNFKGNIDGRDSEDGRDRNFDSPSGNESTPRTVGRKSK